MGLIESNALLIIDLPDRHVTFDLDKCVGFWISKYAFDKSGIDVLINSQNNSQINLIHTTDIPSIIRISDTKSINIDELDSALQDSLDDYNVIDNAHKCANAILKDIYKSITDFLSEEDKNTLIIDEAALTEIVLNHLEEDPDSNSYSWVF